MNDYAATYRDAAALAVAMLAATIACHALAPGLPAAAVVAALCLYGYFLDPQVRNCRSVPRRLATLAPGAALGLTAGHLLAAVPPPPEAWLPKLGIAAAALASYLGVLRLTRTAAGGEPSAPPKDPNP